MPEEDMEKAPVLPIPDLHLDYLPQQPSSPQALPDGTRVENILDLDLDFSSATKTSLPSSSLPSRNKDVDLLSGDMVDVSSFGSSNSHLPTLPAATKTELSSHPQAKPAAPSHVATTGRDHNQGSDSILDLM